MVDLREVLLVGMEDLAQGVAGFLVHATRSSVIILPRSALSFEEISKPVLDCLPIHNAIFHIVFNPAWQFLPYPL